MAMVCDRYDVYVVNGDVKNAIGGHSFVYDRLLKNYSDILGPVDESLIKGTEGPVGGSVLILKIGCSATKPSHQ